ncbi:hypothetical protein [Aquabacterium sp.]|uniref:hypothetical protein n=1 Tax=Aquabacterium sp. TaxID=1872578 RepID=UPI002C237C70|nr:hypothetical protein [Aquabacterium sp.]HSW04619.1 hypothetical protein [Aquabacterium sp.]
MPTPLTWIVLAAAGLVGWTALRKTQDHRAVKLSHAKTRALQTWEGEGGGLPDGGPQVKQIETGLALPPSETPK